LKAIADPAAAVNGPEVGLPYYVKALAMALPAVLLGIQISGWVFFIKSIREGHPDFRANYTAGLMVASGQSHQLYNYDSIKALQDRVISREIVGMPFIHPAYEALAYVPVSLLRFRAAFCAFLIVNLLVVFLCYRALRPEIQKLAIAWAPLPFVLCFTFLPVGAALMQGQDSILLLALFVWSWVLMKHNEEFPAGLVLGLTVFRFQFLAPICLLFLLWRRWRIAAGLLVSATVSLLISVAMVGISGARSYVTMLASMSVGGVSELDRVRYYQPVAAMGSMRALITDTLSRHVPVSWIQLVIVLASLGIILWAARAATSQTSSSDLLLLAVTVSAIVGYHIFVHDFAILLLPLAVWAARSINSIGSGNPTLVGVLLGTTTMFVAPALMIFRVVHFCWVAVAVILFLGAQIGEIRHWEKALRNGRQNTTIFVLL
jgi:hypothetical protein